MKIKPPKNLNYCASIVEIKNLIPIEKADKIQVASIFGNSVVVSKELSIGTKGVFFTLECQLEEAFLSKHNLYRDATKNIDASKVGFFETNGRIRAVSLRGQKSEGFFISFSNLHSDYKELIDLEVGTDFDYLNDECICRKYVVIRNVKSNSEKKSKAENRFSRIVDNQFHLHIDTIQAKKNFRLIQPNDIISITDKWHGTSAVFSNLLINRKLNWLERILLKFKVNINTVEFGNIYSSRKVIKNKYINENVEPGFYKTDIWSLVNDDIKDLIPKGVSIYGEIVGFIPGSGKSIQGGYNYSCQPNTYKFLVYRITNTNSDGKVIEYSWNQIKDFCVKSGLYSVKEFFYGYAKDLYKDILVDDNWNENVLTRISKDFNLERECKYNKSMPAEGIIIRKDDLYRCEPMKLKSFAFLKHETELLDSGESDIESDQ